MFLGAAETLTLGSGGGGGGGGSGGGGGGEGGGGGGGGGGGDTSSSFSEGSGGGSILDGLYDGLGRLRDAGKRTDHPLSFVFRLAILFICLLVFIPFRSSIGRI